MLKTFTRKKNTPLLLRIFYFLNRFRILSPKTKLNFYLELEWIASRLARETANTYFTENNSPFDNTIHSFLLQQINSSLTVLDLGCGLGEKSLILAQKAKRVTGIDYNKSHIDFAQKTFIKPNLNFLNIDAFEFLKTDTQGFDVLILSHILEHIEDRKEFLIRFKSHFKWIYIELPDLEASDLNLYRIKLNSNFQYTDDDHVVEYDRKELLKLLEECDLQVIESEYRFGVQKYWCVV